MVLEAEMVKEGQFWFSEYDDINVTVNSKISRRHVVNEVDCLRHLSDG